MTAVRQHGDVGLGQVDLHSGHRIRDVAKHPIPGVVHHFVAELFVDNLKRFAAGQPLREVVDPDRGY